MQSPHKSHESALNQLAQSRLLSFRQTLTPGFAARGQHSYDPVMPFSHACRLANRTTGIYESHLQALCVLKVARLTCILSRMCSCEALTSHLCSAGMLLPKLLVKMGLLGTMGP